VTETDETPATDDDRMAVVQALSAARRNEELSAEVQLERTELALAATTLDELRALVADLRDPPTLPVAGVSRRGLLMGLGGLTAVVVGVGTAIAVGSDDDEPAAATPPPRTSTTPTPTPTPTPTATPTPKQLPSLFTVAGLELLLRDYRKKFGTWWTYELSIFGERQARSDVPIGPLRKRRLQWWSWDEDDRWNTIFDPQAATPLNQPMDLRKVDLKAALANRRVARRTLNVEEPKPPDIEFTTHPDYGPVVQFFVTNSFNESGLMFTDLDGRILSRQPFQRS